MKWIQKSQKLIKQDRMQKEQWVAFPSNFAASCKI